MTRLSPAWLKTALLVGAVAALCFLWGTRAFSAGVSNDTLWNSVRSGGHVLLLRHAIAPGIGDPPGFRIGDCGTQRNLSNTGRNQARRIGERIRAKGVMKAHIFSSQWCRCLETARLLGLGPVRELSVLNSFFQHPGRREAQTQALHRWLAGQRLDTPLVLVTHEVNIAAFTGISPESGEVIILRRLETGTFSVVGTVRTE